MSDLVNLTPHRLRVIASDGEVLLDLAGHKMPARCAERTTPAGELHIDHRPIPLVAVTYGAIIDLPSPVEGTHYIVSRLVADACPHRTDLLVPINLVRDADGQLTGCQAFAVGSSTGPRRSADVAEAQTMEERVDFWIT